MSDQNPPDERYVSPFPKPTPHEAEILDILAEECAEVIVAISKIKRFGAGDASPTTRIPNRRVLGLEIGDLRHMMHRAEALGLYTIADMHEGVSRKSERLKRYLQTAA